MRHDFSQKTKRLIARRVSHLCSKPDCRVMLMTTHTHFKQASSIGVAAHICAASPGGARYDASLSKEQRQNADNGIWLCQSHAVLIDKQPDKYPLPLLQSWKQQAGAYSKQLLNEPVMGEKEAVARLKAMYQQEGELDGVEVIRVAKALGQTELDLSHVLGRLRMANVPVEQLQNLFEQKTPSLSLAQICCERGQLHYNNSKYELARVFYEIAAALVPDKSFYTNWAGFINDTLARYKQAIEYYGLALASDLKTYGEDHSNVAIRRNNIGASWKALGEYNKAIEYYELALASDLKTYGEERSQVAIYRNNIGSAWESLGEYNKAIEYYELALASDLKTYGEEHPKVAIRRNNIGGAWQALGEYNKAIEYYELALASDLKTYGEEHSTVAIRRNNIALVWQSLGEYNKAIEYFELALVTLEKVFDKNHPHCEIVRGNLAKVLEASANKNKPQKVNKVADYRLIQSPGSMSIYNSETTEFVETINQRFGKEKCLFDFSNTQQISDEALIVIYAALDSAKHKGNFPAKIKWSKSEKINQILKTSHLQKLIEQQEIQYNLESPTQVLIVNERCDHDAIVDYIQHKIYHNQMAPETEYVFGDAVSETINNVQLHAYPNREDEDQSWWLLCKVEDGQLNLAIYDRGIGIPKTVSNKFPETQKLSDEQMINLSMTGDVSGTNKSKHGQGSKSIRALVDGTDGGKLWVFSNNGLYSFEQGQGKPDLHRLPSNLPGTLVQWNIKLNENN